MATTLEVASNALVTSQDKLLREYLTRARKMWGSLTPADWWNDGVLFGAAARLSLWELSFIASTRRLGVSYADETLRSIGVTPSGSVHSLVYPRAETDPWMLNARVGEAYRSAAVKHPEVRPVEWPDKDDLDWQTVEEWLKAADKRLETNARTNMERASTSATIERYRSSGVTTYRRILHPELSKTGCCGLCIVAADRTYKTSVLLPLHLNCRCGVAPVGSDADKGFDLNNADLRALYNAAGGNTAQKLKNIRVQQITNSDLGPILTTGQAKANANEHAYLDYVAPDRHTTREQLKKMTARAQAFEQHYANVMKTGKSDSFSYDGKHYIFKPSAHLKQAWSYQRALIQQVHALLR